MGLDSNRGVGAVGWIANESRGGAPPPALPPKAVEAAPWLSGPSPLAVDTLSFLFDKNYVRLRVLTFSLILKMWLTKSSAIFNMALNTNLMTVQENVY